MLVLEHLMNRMIKHFDDSASALMLLAQPVIVAMGSAGLTGGAMAAAGILAGRLVDRHSHGRVGA